MVTDKILYKYRSWQLEHHRKVLLQNEFYFASPSEINDPFDLRVSPNLLLLDTPEKKLQFLDEILGDAKKILQDRNISFEERKNNLLALLEKNIDKMQEEYDELHSQYTNDRFGVISFSFRWDSILMWSHYGDNHKGFCIGLDRGVVESLELFDSAGPIEYRNDFPNIDPLNYVNIPSIISKTHTKAKEWEYEREYRLVKLWADGSPSNENRKLIFPQECIVEVIIGKNTSLKDQDEILNAAAKNKIPVFKIRSKPRSFLLEKIRV